jgi:hypothetical protein
MVLDCVGLFVADHRGHHMADVLKEGRMSELVFVCMLLPFLTMALLLATIAEE